MVSSDYIIQGIHYPLVFQLLFNLGDPLYTWSAATMYITVEILYPATNMYMRWLFKVVPYTSGKIWSACMIFLFFWQCVWIYPLINIKILTNSNQQTRSYKFTSHIAAFLSVVLITEMLEIYIQTSYDQNVQLILKSYLPVVLGTTLSLVYTRSQFIQGLF